MQNGFPLYARDVDVNVSKRVSSRYSTHAQRHVAYVSAKIKWLLPLPMQSADLIFLAFTRKNYHNVNVLSHAVFCCDVNSIEPQ